MCTVQYFFSDDAFSPPFNSILRIPGRFFISTPTQTYSRGKPNFLVESAHRPRIGRFLAIIPDRQSASRRTIPCTNSKLARYSISIPGYSITNKVARILQEQLEVSFNSLPCVHVFSLSPQLPSALQTSSQIPAANLHSGCDHNAYVYTPLSHVECIF